MTALEPPVIRNVRFSDGGTFQTTARTASEYLFAPEFLRYYVICIVLYAAMMSGGTKLHVDLAAGVIFWASILMTSFAFLLAAVWVNVLLVDRGVLKYVHTYAALVPVVVFNSFMVSYLMHQFGDSLGANLGSLIALTARNIVIVACYDILHGRYVAPRHPMFVPKTAPEDDAVSPVPPRQTSDQTTDPQSVPTVAKDNTTTTDKTVRNVDFVQIGNTSFAHPNILWIKSEDHYLKVQMANSSQMVRGKLSATVDKLDKSLGLQINRSVWVAFEAIELVEKKGGYYVVVKLSDETTHRIANSRRLIFKANYDSFLATHT